MCVWRWLLWLFWRSIGIEVRGLGEMVGVWSLWGEIVGCNRGFRGQGVLLDGGSYTGAYLGSDHALFMPNAGYL